MGRGDLVFRPRSFCHNDLLVSLLSDGCKIGARGLIEDQRVTGPRRSCGEKIDIADLDRRADALDGDETTVAPPQVDSPPQYRLDGSKTVVSLTD